MFSLDDSLEVALHGLVFSLIWARRSDTPWRCSSASPESTPIPWNYQATNTRQNRAYVQFCSQPWTHHPPTHQPCSLTRTSTGRQRQSVRLYRHGIVIRLGRLGRLVEHGHRVQVLAGHDQPTIPLIVSDSDRIAVSRRRSGRPARPISPIYHSASGQCWR